MRISYLFVPCILIVNTITFNVHAQENKPVNDKWQIGVNGGAFVYQGDLTSDKAGSFKTVKPGLTISATKPLGFIALKTAFTFASLKGDDDVYKTEQAYRGFRQFKFETQLAEVMAQANIYFHNEHRKTWRFNPYLTTGIGGVYFFNNKINTSQTQFSYFNNADLRNRFLQDSAKGMPSFVLAIPLGAGFNFRISDRILFNLEGVQRFLNTDYMDGFSIAANPARRDQFFSLTAGIHFVIGKKAKGDKTGKPAAPINTSSPSTVAPQQPLRDTVYLQVAQKAKTDTLYKMMNDRDRDGIADSVDLCPDIAGRIEYKGCPQAEPVKMTGAATFNSITKHDIYFDYDRVSLTGQAYIILYEIVRQLKEDNTLKVIFKGHTDLDGSAEYNNLLSWRRAAICSDFLQSYTIDKARISIEALGKQQPVVSQTAEPNLQWKNRRVEVIIYREK